MKQVKKSEDKIYQMLDNPEIADFCFLTVGHWLSGRLGEDRKDIGMTIKTFCTVFKGLPKGKQPGLILKTSSAGFSVIDREYIAEKIDRITEEFGDACPPIYLLFGDLNESEMNSLYNDPKVKSMMMLSKGEGYGRPLAEFCTTGKPIITSKWSGHVDFLPEEHTVFVSGELTTIHSSAVNTFLLKDSKWFTVNYSDAAQKMNAVYSNYKKHLLESNGLQNNIRKNFSLQKMTTKLGEIFDSRIKTPEKIEMQLPQLPTMKKV